MRRGDAAGFLLLVLVSTAGIAGAVEPVSAFKVLVLEPGVYRVDFDFLRAAGLESDHVDSRLLSLTNRGRSIPIHVVDGGDGHFESGDYVEFVAERLAGHRSYYDEYSRTNVYRLGVGAADARRMDALEVDQESEAAETQPDALLVRHHWEEDVLRGRFRGRDGVESPEVWYWAKLTHIDPEPFRHEIDLSALQKPARRPVSIRVALRGWSTRPRRPNRKLPDHRVEVFLNETRLGVGEWDGQDAFTVEIDEVPAETLRPGPNHLALRVPKRKPAEGSDWIIDVVLLNWIEIEFPRDPIIRSTQTTIHLTEDVQPGRPLELLVPQPNPLVIYSGGFRFETDVIGPAPEEGLWRQRFLPAPGQKRLYAVQQGGLLGPLAVVADQESDLRNRERQADYLIIAHRSLIDAIEPLAVFHRHRGLSTEVVDVEDVYDEFNHGLPHPRAIRDFVTYAYHEWRPPVPRFVLLVGDASWDPGRETQDERYADWTYRPGESRSFTKNSSTPYRHPGLRNLVPTWSVETYEGHAASDNWLVSVDGDDDLPDLAVGRFAVTQPAEVAAIVAKTIAYATQSGVGPWRRNLLWITNERPGMQRRSDELAAYASSLGFADLKVYPKPEEPDNVRHQARLREALGRGNLLVHFLGHGGRYIWRTGPPSLKKNHDLFTLEDLDRLAPTSRLPVVLSMTCYSAPFDHPTADSIGEKLLRLEGRGAVAVLAASWRNDPSQKFSKLLIEELTRPTTVGEAIMRAKRRLGVGGLLVETYNLLGDPAIDIAVPSHRLQVDATATDLGWRVSVSKLPDRFRGQAIVEWLGQNGEGIKSAPVEVSGPRFDITRTPPPRGATLAEARVYAWDEKQGLDGIGAVALTDGDGPSRAAAQLRSRER
jgi:hypothetical protein